MTHFQKYNQDAGRKPSGQNRSHSFKNDKNIVRPFQNGSLALVVRTCHFFGFAERSFSRLGLVLVLFALISLVAPSLSTILFPFSALNLISTAKGSPALTSALPNSDHTSFSRDNFENSVLAESSTLPTNSEENFPIEKELHGVRTDVQDRAINSDDRQGGRAQRDDRALDDKTDFLLQTIVESNPTTPEELLQAVENLLRLEKRAAARVYFLRLVDANLTTSQMVDLHAQFGSPIFVKLSSKASLKPESPVFVKSVLDAASEYANSPERIDQLLAELYSANPLDRHDALDKLRQTGHHGLTILIDQLQQPLSEIQREQVHQTLLEFAPYSTSPLIAALASRNKGLRKEAVFLLGELGEPEAIPYLIHPFLASDSSNSLRQETADAYKKIVDRIPTRAELLPILVNETESYLAGRLPRGADPLGNYPLWLWNDQTRQVEYRDFSGKEASGLLAAHLARDLYEVTKEKERYLKPYLLSSLQRNRAAFGFHSTLQTTDSELFSICESQTDAFLSELLGEALKKRQTYAVASLLEVIGTKRDSSYLDAGKRELSPLVRALRHGNRHIRFAACRAIMKIPNKPDFPGMSHFIQELAHFSCEYDSRRVLVVHPLQSRAQTLAGNLARYGFHCTTAKTSREGLLEVQRSQGFTFILLSDQFPERDIFRMAQLFRQDYRTSNVPLVLMGGTFEKINFSTYGPTGSAFLGEARKSRRTANEMRAERFLEIDRHSIAIEQPATEETYRLMLRHIAPILEANRMGVEPEEEELVCQRQAIEALTWLYEIARSEELTVQYELLSQEEKVATATDHPLTFDLGVKILSETGSRVAQKRLAQLLQSPSHSLKQREMAADALLYAIEKRYLRLTGKEVLHLQESAKIYRESGIDFAGPIERVLLTLGAKERRNH
ncbi:MAG: hypothetical protein MPJ24_02525 [Pirellulaceae bacterium]|nr:hypothetical protein [Pirellulaceae bacterium]